MTLPTKRSTPSEAATNRLKRTVGQNVKRARTELGMSQRDLAAAASMSQRHIVLIEKLPGANVTISTLVQLGRCLNKTVVELLTPPAKNPPA